MQTFSKRVQIEAGFDAAFFFTKIYAPNGIRFHVSVSDKEDFENYLNFNMECKDLEWKIVDAPKVPDWIMGVEKQLQEIISETIFD